MARGAVCRRQDQHHRGPRSDACGSCAAGNVDSHLLELSRFRQGTKRYKRIVNLGTGGSDLGPRLLADAFGDGTLDVRFVANIDPVELERALAGADPATTLMVVVSKTLFDPGNAGECRGRPQPRLQGTHRGDGKPGSREEIRRHRNPADAGLGRRPLLGLVGGRASPGLLRHRRRRVFRVRSPARARWTSTSFHAALREQRPGADGAARGLERRTSSACRRMRCCPTRTGCACCPPTCSSWRWNRTARAWTARAGRSPTRPAPWSSAPKARRRSTPSCSSCTRARRPVAADFIDASVNERALGQRARAGRRAGVRDRRRGAAAAPAASRQPAFAASSSFRQFTPQGPRPADRALRAQGLHPGRALEHQQLRPVGRRAGQATRATHSRREVAWTRKRSTSASASS